ncbi:DUF2244 domain-containing protein [Phenylobacterium sp. RIFCSPHIGHO2_01_FULL_69_31]|uniref:DUF2244 domain-containing protein n=1 Tax=Phenylobacterium sp. RIFCSPHIGHO2_01_FULL_69_31 TaxID=1801944 RepID=UPI0025FB91D6|nr:DUF2244 domain-containing protein [Phenylobacterium sp. RIFCSPHIGHO2_01_FULL_69_31]
MRASSAGVDFGLSCEAMSRPLYMDAEIKPNRSLSERGFVILISIITAANVASAVVFIRMGAHYVVPFLGLDVLAVVVAFAVSFRAGKVIERVQVSPTQVRITRETPKDIRVIWESPTAFTRVATVRDEEDRVMALTLRLSGRETAVAAALSPGERGEFARALEDAIWRARRGAI